MSEETRRINIEEVPFEVSDPPSPPTARRVLEARRKPQKTAEQRKWSGNRGKQNRANGTRAEKETMVLFKKAGWMVIAQGGPNRCDFLALKPGIIYSVEQKRLTLTVNNPKGWPLPWQIRSAGLQATRHAKAHPESRPLVVFSKYDAPHPTERRVYWPDGHETLLEFFARHEDQSDVL